MEPTQPTAIASLSNGWIKLHRNMLDWEWYKDSNTSRLFIHILLKANHADASWQGIEIKSGTFITSRKSLAVETGLSEQQVRTSLNRLISTSEITSKATNKYSMITVNKWDGYQKDNQQDNKQVTSNQPASNHQITTNKNDKKEKNEDNDKKKTKSSRFTPPSVSEVSRYTDLRHSEGKPKINAESFVDFYESKGWMVGSNKMKSWQAGVRNWEKREMNTQSKQEVAHCWGCAVGRDDGHTCGKENK